MRLTRPHKSLTRVDYKGESNDMCWFGQSLICGIRIAHTILCTVASLLSCLHQLRTENVRLEDHVGNLQLRRDHLLAVNARLAIPLTTGMYLMLKYILFITELN